VPAFYNRGRGVIGTRQMYGNNNSLPVLEVTDLSSGYNNAPPAIEGISFRVSHGERVAIVGPNGAGKSTLFKALVGLLPLRSGHIRVGNGDQRRSDQSIAYVPQIEDVDWDFPITVGEVVLLGRLKHMGAWPWPRKRDHEAMMRALEQVGMLEYLGRHISQLSGGQRRRVFIARALAQAAHILLLDEPFSGVDVASQEAILAILDDLRTRGATLLVATHDLNLALSRFDRVMLLNKRLLHDGSPSETITPEALAETYGGQIARWADSVMVIGDHSIQECEGGPC
jgi:ABC-type Mn2+/Zn2+ transport system ATPase subunit